MFPQLNRLLFVKLKHRHTEKINKSNALSLQSLFSHSAAVYSRALFTYTQVKKKKNTTSSLYSVKYFTPHMPALVNMMVV